MTFKPIIACCLMFMSASVLADPQAKDARLLELMQLQGLTEMIDQQRAYGQEQAQAMAAQVSAEFQRHIPAASDAVMAEVQAAVMQFVAAVDASWTTEEAVGVWSRLYGEQITEDELDQIIAFYRSPIGKKSVSATNAAMPGWQAFFQERGQAALNTAMGAYMERIREIAQAAAAPVEQ